MANSQPNDDDADSGQQLPENSVEYALFILGPDPQSASRNSLASLESIRKEALQLSQSLTKDYIWQRQEFNLELKNDQGLVYLHGLTDYADAVEDEWLIVYILRELTKSHPNLWARVADADGEFLLVEAANVLPKWLSPEMDQHRVWIHDGKMFIIPATGDRASSSRNLSLPQAVAFLRKTPDALVHSPFIESEAFYRLEKYPGQVADSIHCSLVTIPRKLAYILSELPMSIAPAVESFYLRDPIGLKPIISSSDPLTFAPEDLVTTSVRFSKILFAQLKSQRFDVPPRWATAFQSLSDTSASDGAGDNTTRLEAGMKLTCGFEILARTASKNNLRVVRELAITLEDLQEDGDSVLPSNAVIDSWPNSRRDDSESWMDINYEDFERELEGKQARGPKTTKSGFGDAQTQADLKKIVSRFESFLNDDDAGIDGAELDDMDMDNDESEDEETDEDSEYEDKEVSFDEEAFAKMMREMMGLPSTEPSSQSQPNNSAKDQPRAPPEKLSAHDEEDNEVQKLSSQMEAELKGHGALKLDAPSKKQRQLKDKGKNPEQGQEQDSSAENAEEDSDAEVDIDYNLARNLLESFKSQAGMAGPTGNLLGMMGFQLPRDEDDGGENAEDDDHETK